MNEHTDTAVSEAVPTTDYPQQAVQVVAKAYTLEASLNGRLDGLLAQAIAEYKALPSAERTAAKQSSIASQYMGVVNGLEADADAQINTLIAELKEIEQASGGSIALSAAVRSYYEAAKSNKKAELINRLFA